MSTNNTPSVRSSATAASAASPTKARKVVGLDNLSAAVPVDALPEHASGDATADVERKKQEARVRKEQERMAREQDAASRAANSKPVVVTRSQLGGLSLEQVGSLSPDDLMSALLQQSPKHIGGIGSSGSNSNSNGYNTQKRGGAIPASPPTERLFTEEQTERFEYVGAAFRATQQINTFLNESGLWSGSGQVTSWTDAQRQMLLRRFDLDGLCDLYHVCSGIAAGEMLGSDAEGNAVRTTASFSDDQRRRSQAQARRLYNIIFWALGSEDDADLKLFPDQGVVFYAVRKLRRQLKQGLVMIPRLMREIGYAEVWVDAYLSWEGRHSPPFGGVDAFNKLPSAQRAQIRGLMKPLIDIRDSVKLSLDMMSAKSRDAGIASETRRELREGAMEVGRLVSNLELRVRTAFGVGLPTPAERQQEARKASGFVPLRFSTQRLVVVEDEVVDSAGADGEAEGEAEAEAEVVATLLEADEA